MDESAKLNQTRRTGSIYLRSHATRARPPRYIALTTCSSSSNITATPTRAICSSYSTGSNDTLER